MSAELDYVKGYPILSLVRELQDERGYTYPGLVNPVHNRDQKTKCPIHDDSEPSAKAYAGTNSFYCWVCGRAWDAPGLYATYYGVGLGEAISVLLSRMGVARVGEGRSDLKEVTAALEARGDGSSLTRGQAEVFRGWIWWWAMEHCRPFNCLDVVIEECEHPLFPDDPQREVAEIKRLVGWAVSLHQPGKFHWSGPRLDPPPFLDNPVIEALAGVS